jgi:hypothetical protein
VGSAFKSCEIKARALGEPSRESIEEARETPFLYRQTNVIRIFRESSVVLTLTEAMLVNNSVMSFLRFGLKGVLQRYI